MPPCVQPAIHAIRSKDLGFIASILPRWRRLRNLARQCDGGYCHYTPSHARRSRTPPPPRFERRELVQIRFILDENRKYERAVLIRKKSGLGVAMQLGLAARGCVPGALSAVRAMWCSRAGWLAG